VVNVFAGIQQLSQILSRRFPAITIKWVQVQNPVFFDVFRERFLHFCSNLHILTSFGNAGGLFRSHLLICAPFWERFGSVLLPNNRERNQRRPPMPAIPWMTAGTRYSSAARLFWINPVKCLNRFSCRSAEIIQCVKPHIV